jgi:hypothetical protein
MTHNNIISEIILLAVGTTAGVASITIVDIDVISGILLKWVSIGAFILAGLTSLGVIDKPFSKKSK